MVFTGIHRIGVARTSALVAVTPLFAVVLAVLFLGERPSGVLLLGAGCVVAGGALLSYRGPREMAWRPRDMVFPVLGALGFAIRDNISRFGLRAFPYPLVAAAAATVSSAVVMALYVGCRRGTERPGLHPVGLAFCALAGLAEGVAYLTMWRALAGGDVSVVSPLVHVQPLFTIVLALIFLRDLERVTWRIGAAAVLIVAGVVLVMRFGTGA
jgi:drug/metabolite transporter (DMT)-like permease